jgi:hypothetical protein
MNRDVSSGPFDGTHEEKRDDEQMAHYHFEIVTPADSFNEAISDAKGLLETYLAVDNELEPDEDGELDEFNIFNEVEVPGGFADAHDENSPDAFAIPFVDPRAARTLTEGVVCDLLVLNDEGAAETIGESPWTSTEETRKAISPDIAAKIAVEPRRWWLVSGDGNV